MKELKELNFFSAQITRSHSKLRLMVLLITTNIQLLTSYYKYHLSPSLRFNQRPLRQVNFLSMHLEKNIEAELD